MRSLLFILGAMGVVGCSEPAAAVPAADPHPVDAPVPQADVSAPPPRSWPAKELAVLGRSMSASGDTYSESVTIGAGVQFDATLTATNKGNGLFVLGNLALRVYDEHDDGLLLPDGLAVNLVDLDTDAYLDVVVSGTVLHTGDQPGDDSWSEVVVYIFGFDPSTRSFVERFQGATEVARGGLYLKAR